MIVPVKRWANGALFGLSRVQTISAPKTAVIKPAEKKLGMLASFEKMLTVQAETMVRQMND